MLSIGYGPLWRIDGPPPQAPLYTLLGASRVLTDVDEGGVERWINGVKLYPYGDDSAHVHDACSSGSSRVKAEGGSVALPEYAAMTVYLTETCSTHGIFGKGMSDEEVQARFTARALALFSAVEAAAVEREFLAGDVLSMNPHLADGNGSFPWGITATSVPNAFAVLENEIGNSHRRGMIHCSPGLAAVAAGLRLIERDARTGTLQTINGTLVVPGYGYSGNKAPAGKAPAAAPLEWVYATGPVEVRRSEAFLLPENLSEALDRDQNTVTYRVERYYMVDWDTAVQSAVLVDRCSSECGTVS